MKMLRNSLILLCILAFNSCIVHKAYVRRKSPEVVDAIKNQEFLWTEQDKQDLETIETQIKEEQDLIDLIRNQ